MAIKEVEKRASTLIQTIAERMNVRLAAAGDWPALTPDVKVFIAKRRPPSALEKYDSYPRALDVAALDIREFSERVLQYTYIKQYKINKRQPHALRTAFVSHVHRLERSELYVLLEIGADILSYLAALADNFGILQKDQSKTFEKKFKERFRHELIDRHRMVHRHQRPSLTTRMLDAINATAKKEEVAAIITSMMDRISEFTDALPELESGIKAAVHSKNSSVQADEIWQLFYEHALATVS